MAPSTDNCVLADKGKDGSRPSTSPDYMWRERTKRKQQQETKTPWLQKLPLPHTTTSRKQEQNKKKTWSPNSVKCPLNLLGSGSSVNKGSWNLGTEESAKSHLAASKPLLSVLLSHVLFPVKVRKKDKLLKNGGPTSTSSDITLWTSVAKFTLKLFWICEMQLLGLLLLPHGILSEATPPKAREEQKMKNSSSQKLWTLNRFFLVHSTSFDKLHSKKFKFSICCSLLSQILSKTHLPAWRGPGCANMFACNSDHLQLLTLPSTDCLVSQIK